MQLIYRILRLFRRAAKKTSRVLSSYNQILYLKGSKVKAHWKSMRLYGYTIWDIKPGADVVFGENFVCTGGVDLTIDLYVGSKVYVSEKASLHIGDNFGMSSSSIQCCNSISIGSNVLVGAGCLIMDSDFHDLNYKIRRVNHGNKTAKCYPVVIGDDVFIGARSIICKGVTIGSRSIVAAGSVVKQNIPADEIWGGNPASFIKKINNN